MLIDPRITPRHVLDEMCEDTRCRSVNAVRGSRILYVENDTVKTGTVCGIERRRNNHRTVFYRISEEAAAEIDKADVVSIATPNQIKAELVKCLLDEAVLENIKHSASAVRKYELDNSPYLPLPSGERAIEKVGGIRI